MISSAPGLSRRRLLQAGAAGMGLAVFGISFMASSAMSASQVEQSAQIASQIQAPTQDVAAQKIETEDALGPWCGAFRSAQTGMPAASFAIAWGDPVAYEDLPRAVFLRTIAPEVQITSELGDFIVAGADGSESWRHAKVVCLDLAGNPVGTSDAVLDENTHS